MTAYEPEPVAEWRYRTVRDAMARTLDRTSTGRRVPALIDGREVMTPDTIDSVDPTQPTRIVAVSASCTSEHADAAVAAARAAFPAWARRSPAERAAVLFAAAQHLRSRRLDLAALQVAEAGKPWAEADADVCEAIDFCEYYGREALRLTVAARCSRLPAERNELRYEPRGVVVVISPWNFPLAIPTGMVVAALVAGNAVVLKPAEQTPAIAWGLIDALRAAGVPHGVLGFLPGMGEAVGAALVEHVDVDAVIFTGSREVGFAIAQAAAVQRPGQRSIKRVITELGGKNPMIVAADADLDQVVPAVVHSAFGFAGQKCSALSRLIVDARVHDALVERIVGATEVVPVGDPRAMGTVVGPVIDQDARAKIRELVDAGRTDGRALVERFDVPEEGYFVGPTVVGRLPRTSRLWREEVFGPVLAIVSATDLDEALDLANDTPYALTAGVFSRSPTTIERCARELRAGNVYINRGTTGAVVGRQPFGGSGLSGVGSKAGGPDYLAQLLQPRTITENTVRQGFAAE